MYKTYTNTQLYTIASDNYKNLVRYCSLLYQEGYWEKAENIINQTIYETLDIYMQAVLLNLALYDGTMNEEERNFILTIPDKNALNISLQGSVDDETKNQSERIANSPPILIQLCGLRDSERNSNIASIFFDSILNILLSMSYLNGMKDGYLVPFIVEYYKKVSSFVNRKNTSNPVTFHYPDATQSDVNQSDVNQSDTNHISIQRMQLTSASNKDNPKEKKEDWFNYFETIRKNRMNKNEMDYTIIEDNNVDKKIMNEIEEKNKENNLEQLFEELNSLIGLENVKEEINSLVNLIKVRKLRQNYNMPSMDMSFHMVFTGNPGTGKTTVARLISKIYKELGLLSKGHFIETDRAGLVAGYVGQTAIKVKDTVEKALGGVLFIDEAYSLSNNVGTNDFGGEAIDTLVKMMEDHRDDLVVIVAGYNEEMQTFLKSNTGLISRFNKFIDFPDYTIEELIDILNALSIKNCMSFDGEAIEVIKEKISSMHGDKRRQFGNARGIRNVFEKIVVNQANRIVTYENPTMDQLQKIIVEDVKNTIE